MFSRLIVWPGQQVCRRLYAGLDSELLAELDKLEFVTITDSPPDFKQAILLFLPEEVEQIKALLQETEVLFSQDQTFIASRAHYETAFDALVEVKDKFNIVNNPTALMKIFELASKNLRNMQHVN